MSQSITNTDVDKIKAQVQMLMMDLDKLMAGNENIEDWEITLQNRYKHLSQTSKTLFRLILTQYGKPNFNQTAFQKNLDFMLESISKIQNGTLNQHDASVNVGEELAIQFIPQYQGKK